MGQGARGMGRKGFLLLAPCSLLLKFLFYRLHDGITFLLATASNHELSKHIAVLCNLEGCHCGNASGTNHKYSAHFLLLFYDDGLFLFFLFASCNHILCENVGLLVGLAFSNEVFAESV